ncbi:amino acid adenylation domain [Herpetosiphon aurantiacus DSM 785]|uniref:Amino acid adenylation domain n=2 Tax=Herpetosiphon TaxID=64 RepID=A9AUJ7_HERA2|nr:amino acid adenylation domain [Herpetosiphon aurantiacus DSM 785]
MSEHSDDSLRNQTDPASRRVPLSAAKKARLEKRLRGDSDNQQAESSIPRLATYDQVPLSFAQERLWFLSQYEPTSSNAYIIPLAVRIDGPIDPSLLEQALQLVVDRHASFRTTFHAQNGVPFQRVAPQLPLRLPVLGLDVADASDEAAVLQVVLDQLVPLLQLPFDLEHGPLLRATLLRLAAESHVLLLICHHIISDGWSMGVLLRDFASFLGALRTNTAPDVPPLVVQAPDVAVWQRQRLQGHYLTTLQDFWKQQLADLEPLNVPTDFVRPAQQSYRGATLSFQLPAALSTQLQRMAQQHDVTPFMLLLAAFQAFLARLSGQQDLAIGSVLASRADADLDPVIGFLVNTWTLRNNIDVAQPLAQLLPTVRRTVLAAFEHRDLPFEQVVQLVQPERDLSRSPVFQVMMTYQNVPQRQMEWGDVRLTPISLPSTVAKFDLTLALSETPEGFRGVMEYRSDLFRRSTIATMVARWEMFLHGIVADFTTSIARLPLVLPAERSLLLDTLNATTTAYPHDQSVASLFAEQARLWPERIALRFGEHSLSYHALEQRANQLAHHLQLLGVGPEHVVGLCVERSLDLVVAILAILKAGAAYAPVDPSYPVERLAWMLSDLQPTVVIAQHGVLDRLPSVACSVVVLETIAAHLAAYPTTAPTVDISPENLAYVMYTSGSTGRPKGIMINQRNIVRLVRNTTYAAFGPDQVGLLLATVAFDASTFELWGCLLNGGRLVIAPPQQLSLAELGHLVEREQITTLWLTAGLFHQMVDHALDRLGSLRQLLAGGDRLSPVHVHKVLERWPQCRLINGYGPTENTTFSCCQQLSATTDLAQGVPIGQPIANSTAYILDRLLQLVPIGVVGELYLGGAGLARGYLARPDQTAAAFIPNPMSQTAGERLYRSGDLARYRDDGTIEFIGRRDQQVKVRGYRIELEEIVGVLLAQPQVDDAVVVVREDRVGDQRLVAYLVGDNPAIELIEQAVQGQVPSYMLPSAYVVLDALPLTANGKVDRRRLPAPSYAAIANDDPPQTDLEQAIAAIWAEVLAVPSIQRQTNFFQVGGHSLSATQLIVRLRQMLNRDLPLQLLFDYPYLYQLAEQLEQQPTALPTAIQPIPRHQRLPLTSAQQRVWFFEQLVPNTAMYTIALQLRLSGKLEPALLQQAINLLIARHEILRASFHGQAGQPWLHIANHLTLDLELIDLRKIDIEQQSIDVQKICQRLAYASYQLEYAPLLRFCLIQLGVQSAILLFTIQHSITDAWSIDLLLQELWQIYADLIHQRPLSLAELSVQYVDFAAWQAAWLATPAAQRQLSYWLEQLAEAPRLLALPTDYPRPDNQTFAGSVVSLELPQPLTHELRSLSQHQHVTLFMLLLAAFKSLLYRYTGQTDLCVGSPIANRGQPELQTMLGFFINTLVLRSRIQPAWSFLELLATVRATTLAAYAQQDLPLEKIIEQLKLERDLSYNPLFQVMFNFRHDFAINRQHYELAIEAEMLANGTSKFDLTLDVADRGSTLLLWVEYNSALFAPATIERMLAQFQVLLNSICAHPGQQLSTLELRTPNQIAQLEQARVALLQQLEQHPAISQAVVLVRPDLPQANWVVGYVVKQPNQQLELGQLQASIQTTYPLVQLALYEVPDMPLDAAGTVDHAGLSKYGQPLLNQQLQQPAVQSPTEAMLAEKRAKLSADKRSLLEKRLKQLRGE